MFTRSGRVEAFVLALVVGLTACSSDSATAVSGVPPHPSPPSTAAAPDVVGEFGANEFGEPTAPLDVVVGPSADILPAAFDLLTVGAPSDNVNAFPFGGGVFPGGGTRYQQAYSAAQFAGSGAALIRSVRFVGASGFPSGTGFLATSNYTFSLSTITAGINTLSNSNFDGNRGPDNALFASRPLSGPAPSTLVIDGVVPFFYDPSKGNLLLDMVISPGAVFSPINVFYAARNGTANGIFSRYHNFGSATIGWGLVTQFELVRPTVDNLAAVIDDAVAGGTLAGRDQGKSADHVFAAWRNLIDVSQRLAQEGHAAGACATLNRAYLGVDGEERPPDMVGGTAAPVLARFIQAILTQMEC